MPCDSSSHSCSAKLSASFISAGSRQVNTTTKWRRVFYSTQPPTASGGETQLYGFVTRDPSVHVCVFVRLCVCARRLTHTAVTRACVCVRKSEYKGGVRLPPVGA